MALIFFPLSIYFYYEFFKYNKSPFAILSGLFMGLVALIHPAASFCPGFTVTIVTLGILITDLYLDRDPAVVRKVLLGYIYSS
jgi:hypothetical protein